jgi:hypothetical protein
MKVHKITTKNFLALRDCTIETCRQLWQNPAHYETYATLLISKVVY